MEIERYWRWTYCQLRRRRQANLPHPIEWNGLGNSITPIRARESPHRREHDHLHGSALCHEQQKSRVQRDIGSFQFALSGERHPGILLPIAGTQKSGLAVSAHACPALRRSNRFREANDPADPQKSPALMVQAPTGQSRAPKRAH